MTLSMIRALTTTARTSNRIHEPDPNEHSSSTHQPLCTGRGGYAHTSRARASRYGCRHTNFHQVTDQVYRGGQPTDEGWKTLAKLGVKIVIDLRREGESGGHSIEEEARAVRAAGMSFVSIPMKGAPAGPTDEQIAQVLKVFDSNRPAFVHCKEGKDRTGTVIACYRRAHQGWDSGKALAEARALGLHWYETGMKAYVQSFRPDTVRAAQGVSPQAPTTAAGQ